MLNQDLFCQMNNIERQHLERICILAHINFTRLLHQTFTNCEWQAVCARQIPIILLTHTRCEGKL